MGADTFTPPGYTRQADLEPIDAQQLETEVSYEPTLTATEKATPRPEAISSQAETRGVIVARDVAHYGTVVTEFGRQQKLAEQPIFR